MQYNYGDYQIMLMVYNSAVVHYTEQNQCVIFIGVKPAKCFDCNKTCKMAFDITDVMVFLQLIVYQNLM